MRVAPQLLEHAQGRAVRQRREHRARRGVDADPDHLGRVDARLGEERGNRLLERAEVVLRVLERPVGLELDAVVRGGQPLVDHAVPVRVDGRAELPPFGAVDQDGAPGLGAEVDPERVAVAHGPSRWGSTTTFSPRRSTSSSKASRHSDSA
jgi:hypothetical protein